MSDTAESTYAAPGVGTSRFRPKLGGLSAALDPVELAKGASRVRLVAQMVEWDLYDALEAEVES